MLIPQSADRILSYGRDSPVGRSVPDERAMRVRKPPSFGAPTCERLMDAIVGSVAAHVGGAVGDTRADVNAPGTDRRRGVSAAAHECCGSENRRCSVRDVLRSRGARDRRLHRAVTRWRRAVLAAAVCPSSQGCQRCRLP